ncbi:Na(+)-translocating NADH-quinone reductase subunit A [Kangiella spongicola]|uniref:Na(+)-translocating NADH-quinone reductase subunit A n=1 Tax=Kangiella spongicola TaxID=796379 RepID=A0A318D5A7_9GAMM|nr:Na(+)-translocating NADH-quinone reductase subunit A [Kangiella spongicola]MBV34836.1 NADH:ubiquinone reductase (Na(+)-transporting) subunit A [Rickettsiales bacterium]PXF64071.1 NADH:ubiquinone reductase (Na(+)-transporting) subunit A [Kangiella spongicola]
MIKIKKGLDLPLEGKPEQTISTGATVKTVAILGEDYVGMKPTMHVQVGDQVKKGQLIFEDKKTPGVKYTAPAAGTISAVNRGAKRKLLSVVVEIADQEEAVSFNKYSADQISGLDRQAIVDQMVESGMWTGLRTRPFSKVPAIDSTTKSIVVSATDTNPLAGDPEVVIKERNADFNLGLDILAKLAEDKVFVATKADSNIEKSSNAKVNYESFSGPHPAGLVGTHIHHLCPASAENVVWHMGYQDVIALGRLFADGELFVERIIALGGTEVKNPRLVRTRLGANVDELLQNEINDNDNRKIAGSVLNGVNAVEARAFVGRYHNQVTVIPEGREKEFFGWAMPGKDKFSVTRAFLGHIFPKKTFKLSTSTGGSHRAIMPIGNYERVLPLDILPTQLIRALVCGDTDTAQQLGCLELDEEDLALCTFVCPGKYEFGSILRENLTKIEKDG